MNYLQLNKHGVLAPMHGVKLIIPKITLNKVGTGDKWDQIEGLIHDYTTLHPEEMRLFLAANKYARAKQANVYGSTRNKSIRWGLNIPPGLSALIMRFFPDLWDGKVGKQNYRKFMRKFPGFRTCEII
jgi:hypothetical protein